MQIHYKLKTAPATRPIASTDIVISSRTGTLGADDAAYVTELIDGAVQRFEGWTGRALITQTWQASIDLDYGAMPDVITLRPAPVQSVTTITEYDEEDDDDTVDTDIYRLDAISTPARIIRRASQSWPTNVRQQGSFVIEYIAGYGAAAAVPNDIKNALRVMVADAWEHRESKVIGASVAEIPSLAQDVVRAYRMTRV